MIAAERKLASVMARKPHGTDRPRYNLPNQLYSVQESFDKQRGRVDGVTKEGGEYLLARILTRKPQDMRATQSRGQKRQRRVEIEKVMDVISTHLMRVCSFVPQAVTDFYANHCFGKALDCPVVETFDAGMLILIFVQLRLR